MVPSFWHVGWLVDSEAHRTVSMGSPPQAAADGAFLQWRSRYFMSQDADRSHSDHSPHSVQLPVTERLNSKKKLGLYSKCLNISCCSALLFYDQSTCAVLFITLLDFGGASRAGLIASRFRVKARTSPHFEPLATRSRALGPRAPILPLGRKYCKNIEHISKIYIRSKQ